MYEDWMKNMPIIISTENYNNNYENKYLQQPISLLTEENLDLLELHCKKQIRREIGQILREHEIVLELLYRYKELESNIYELINKLEADIKDYIEKMDETNIKLNKLHYMKRIEYAKEIMKILKEGKI